MGTIPTREAASLRDIFASNIAGVILGKSDIKVDSDEFYARKVNLHTKVQLETIAFLSYRLADMLLEERIRKY